MADSRYDETGRNSRGRRKIGYKPRTNADTYGGLDEYYALQNRGIPAFGGKGGEMTANQWAQQIRGQGMRLDRSGQLGAAPGGRPFNPREFRNQIRQSREMGGRDGAPQAGGQTFGSVKPMDMGTSLGENSLYGGGSSNPASVNVPSDIGSRPNPNQAMTPDQARGRLEEAAGAARLLRETLNPSPIGTSSPEAVAAGAPNKILRSRYGTGSSTMGPSTTPSTIGGRPSGEFFRDAADRQGIANRFASPTGALDPKKLRKSLAGGNTQRTRTAI